MNLSNFQRLSIGRLFEQLINFYLRNLEEILVGPLWIVIFSNQETGHSVSEILVFYEILRNQEISLENLFLAQIFRLFN